MEQASRVHALVKGRVQGVAFRAYTQEQAVQLGLVGWVRNLPEGDVELEAEGPRAELERLIGWCHHGPPSAWVTSVAVMWISATGDDTSFRIRH